MFTKEDYMCLSKERLAELCVEKDKEILERDMQKYTPELKPFEFPSLDRNDCFHGGPCTNPFHDCINCPRQFSGDGTTISTTQDNLLKISKQ